MRNTRLHDLNPAKGRRQVLGALERALDQTAFALRDHPAECLPQLYARLHADAQTVPGLAAVLEARRRSFARSWLRVVNWRPQPLVRTFAGHEKSIDTCQFCAGGKRIVSASMDGTVRIWDTATGREVAALGGYPWGFFVNIAPDDERFAFPNDSRGLVLASAADGQQLALLTFHDSNVSRCAFSPDGRWLATCGWDCRMAIWDVATATLHRSIYLDSQYAGAVFMPTGRRLVVTAGDTLELWDADEDARRPFSSAGTGPRVGFRLSADGALLASIYDKRTIVVWDVESREVIARQTGHPGDIVDYSFLSDSRRLVSAAAEGPVLVWDARTGEVLARIESEGVDRMQLAPSDRALLLERHKTLSLWEVETARKRADLVGHRLDENVVERLFSRDGRRLFTASGDSTVRAWDTDTGTCVATLDAHKGGFGRCAIDPAGRLFLSGGSDGNLRLWDAGGEKRWLPAAHTAIVSCCAAGPGGRAVASSHDGTVSWWNAEDGVLLRRDGEEGGTSVRACTLSPDGELGAAGGAGGELRISNTRTGELVRRIREYDDPVTACAFSPDATHIAWRDMTHGKFVARTHGETSPETIPGGAVHAIRFVPPGDRLVTVTDQHGGSPYPFGIRLPVRSSVLLFDGRTGARRGEWDSPDKELRDAACSPDGRLIATAGRKVVRLWSVTDGASIAELAHPEGEVFACVFSADGRWLVGSGAGVVRVWRTTTWREHGVMRTPAVCAPEFLPDGRHLVTAVSSALVVWDVKELRPVTTLSGLVTGISATAVAPDGRWLVFGTFQGDVLVAFLDGLKCVPVATAAEEAGSLAVRCPACGARAEIDAAALDHAWRCPSCSARLRVNPFVARSHDEVAPRATMPPPKKTVRSADRADRRRRPGPTTAPAAGVGGAPEGSPAAKPASPAQPPVASSVAHPTADPNRAYRLNLEYQHVLAQWQALPWWRRLWTRRPARPTGI